MCPPSSFSSHILAPAYLTVAPNTRLEDEGGLFGSRLGKIGVADLPWSEQGSYFAFITPTSQVPCWSSLTGGSDVDTTDSA